MLVVDFATWLICNSICIVFWKTFDIYTISWQIVSLDLDSILTHPLYINYSVLFAKSEERGNIISRATTKIWFLSLNFDTGCFDLHFPLIQRICILLTRGTHWVYLPQFLNGTKNCDLANNPTTQPCITLLDKMQSKVYLDLKCNPKKNWQGSVRSLLTQSDFLQVRTSKVRSIPTASMQSTFQSYEHEYTYFIIMIVSILWILI